MTRRRRWLLGAAAVLAAGGLLAWWLLQPSELDRVRAELDAAEPGWRFADFRAAGLADQPPDSENAALVAVAAAGLIPRQYWDWQAAAEAEPDGWWSALPAPGLPPDPAGEAAWAAADEAVATARRAEHLPRGMPVTVLAADPYMTLLPHVDDSNQTTKLLRVDAVRRAAADPAASVGDVRAMLNIARALGREGFAISPLVQSFQSRRAADALFRALARAELPADRLAVLHAELAAAADPGVVAAGLRSRRAGVDLELTAVAAGDVDLRTAIPMTTGRASPLLPGRLRYRLRAAGDHAAALTDLTRLAEVAGRPAHEWEAAVQELPPPPDDDRHLFSHLDGVQARKMLVAAVRHQATLRTAVLAVGCERFRLRHGRWPGRLAELPADLLLADVTDPFTGTPLALKRLPDGLAVYSLGPDREDDGGLFGTAPAQPPRQVVGWRLWDAGGRR